MTPLQVMKLGYLMRQAQKAYLNDKSISAVTLAVELEKQFDEAHYAVHGSCQGYRGSGGAL